MPGTVGPLLDLIFGCNRSRIVHAAAELALFDHLSEAEDKTAADLAAELHLDAPLLYRLLRALASLGLLTEHAGGGFRVTPAGAHLRTDHPASLRAMTLLEAGPVHAAAWRHLPAMIRDGRQDGFVREFGVPIWDQIRQDPAYGRIFHEAMSSYSASMEAESVLAALEPADLSGIRTLCDVGGGQGVLMCAFLRAYPWMTGTVFDLPNVVGEEASHVAPGLGLAERCRYVGGDMFDEVPAADCYVMKHILHDWNDAECVRILANLRRAGSGGARLLICEFVVPGPEQPHFSKIFDIHMLCATSGRERTAEEFAALLDAAGWEAPTVRTAPGRPTSVLDCVARTEARAGAASALTAV